MSISSYQNRAIFIACCGFSAACLGILSLLGWLLNLTALTSLREGYKAIAPSVSCILILLGFVLPRLTYFRLSRNERWLWAVILGFLALLGFTDVLGAMFHRDVNLEDAWTYRVAERLGFSFTPMSPIAGSFLFLTGLGAVLYLLPQLSNRWRRLRTRHLAALLGVCVVLGGSMFLLGYLFREPFLYGSGWIPIAMPAAAGFLLLGLALTSLSGLEQWPLALFVGASTEARLVRTFLPLVVISVLVSSALVLFHGGLEVNHALLAGVFASLAALAAAIVSLRAARVIGQAIDTAQTARLRAEQEYARQAQLLDTIVENTEAHLVYLDRDFNFIRVNTAYARTCGHEPEEMVGLNHFDLFPHEENEAIFRRVRDTGLPFQIHEKPFDFPDQPERGTTYWDWTLTPVKGRAGEVQGLVFALTDVTDAVQQREHLLETERARVRLAQTMVSEIAHRTKNNLQIVAGLLQLQATNRAESAPAEAKLLRETVVRIQSFASLHEKMYGVESEVIDVTDMLRRIAETASQTLVADEVAILVEGQPLTCPARAATNLCVVMSELITNALKHGGPGPQGRQLRLAVTVQENKLELSLWNSGNPISEDFEVSAHVGVGLDVVQAIIAEQYGGVFSLSPQDNGTCAQIVLSYDKLQEEAVS